MLINMFLCASLRVQVFKSDTVVQVLRGFITVTTIVLIWQILDRRKFELNQTPLVWQRLGKFVHHAKAHAKTNAQANRHADKDRDRDRDREDEREDESVEERDSRSVGMQGVAFAAFSRFSVTPRAWCNFLPVLAAFISFSFVSVGLRHAD